MSGYTDGMASAPVERITLIDGHALAFRSYFAIRALTTSRGEPVQAVFGFLRMVLRLLKEGAAPVVVFDPPAPSFRHLEYADYKGGRAATPPDLPQQIDWIRALVDLIGLIRLELPGYEADDVIGSLALQAAERGFDVAILTSDRDSYQLLGERIWVLGASGERIGPQEVLDKYGVRVDQWVDYRALTGDSSDNIPGAKGIGPVGAAALLARYGSLDAILDVLQRGTLEPPKTARLLQASLEQILLSRRLSKIVTDLDLPMDWGELRSLRPQLPELMSALHSLEFSGLSAELEAFLQPLSQGGAQVPADPEVLELPEPPAGAHYYGYRLGPEGGLELGAWDGRSLYQPPPGQAWLLRGALNAVAAKSLAGRLKQEDCAVSSGEDPLLMAYLLDSSDGTPEGAVRRHLDRAWPDAPPLRAQVAEQLDLALRPRLQGPLASLYRDVELPLSEVLAGMEARGILLDTAYLRALSEVAAQRLAALEEQIFAAAGHPFNVASRDQLERVLYDELRLASGKRTRLTNKRSTAAAVLEALRDDHPIVPLLLDHRELSKLKGTYLDPLPSLVNPRSGRLHTSYNQTAVATGRLSSVNPNLQNIPIRTELGREIRKGFLASPGMLLICADYSQIELRVLAHITGDAQLQGAFASGADIHRRTASELFGVSEEAVTAEQRRAAKTVNFGIIYGMSAHRLSGELHIGRREAQAFIDRYFAIFPGIHRYIQETLERCRQTGYAETLLGRRRYVPELASPNAVLREAAERVAYNMPVQGTAADIIKRAMVRLDPALRALGGFLLLQVHDELLIEAPLDRQGEAESLLVSAMEGAMELAVPLAVEVGRGASWFEAK